MILLYFYCTNGKGILLFTTLCTVVILCKIVNHNYCLDFNGYVVFN